MKDDLKNQIDSMHNQAAFIKVTDDPVKGLSDQQKVALVRKANELFNNGKYDMAERIYITTGYSDGLTRIGDVYMEKSDFIKAMKMYMLAHNNRKLMPVLEKAAATISFLLNEN